MVQGEGETERSVFMKKASGKTEKKWTMPELISRYCDSGEMQDDFTTSALEYYKSIEQMEEGICFIDTKKIVKIWNRAIEGIYNIKADEILGRPLDAFFSNAINCRVLGTETSIENQVHNPGRETKIIITSRPVYHKGKLIGVMSIDKPCTQIDQIKSQLAEAKNKIRLLYQELDKYEEIKDDFFVGNDPKIREIMEFATKIAYSDIPIIIYGESGTGKEVLSRFIHKKSKLHGNFVAVNCSAIPDNLFESEFFGYREGAFTGAKKGGFKGYFEQANGGTLFLDEISELPLQQQTKLLRTIQEMKIRPLGADKDIDVNIRIICATNIDLMDKIEDKTFRLDLYYRINGIKLHLPPLRNRKDLKEMIRYFVKEEAAKYNRQKLDIAPETMKLLCRYYWKGNVRELKNIIAQMIILTQGNTILPESIPNEVMMAKNTPKYEEIIFAENIGESLEEKLSSIEKNIIIHALRDNNMNISKTAGFLKIPRSTLHYKMNKYHIEESNH